MENTRGRTIIVGEREHAYTSCLYPSIYTRYSFPVLPSLSSLSLSLPTILNAAFSAEYRSRFPPIFDPTNFHRGSTHIFRSVKSQIRGETNNPLRFLLRSHLPTRLQPVNGRQFCGCCGGSNFERAVFLVSLVSPRYAATKKGRSRPRFSRTGPGNISFRKITGSVNRLPMYKTNIVKRALYLRKGRERER